MITVKQTGEFTAWLNALKDVQGKTRILSRIGRLAAGNPGEHRNLKGGVSELKIDVGPGYRVYYTQIGKVIIVLICGGDKSTQKTDIKAAIAKVATLKAEAEAAKK